MISADSSRVSLISINPPLSLTFTHTHKLSFFLSAWTSAWATLPATIFGYTRTSLEFENEVQREVTSQVIHWFRFGWVDDADERWKMDVRKVVPQYFKSAWVFCFSRMPMQFQRVFFLIRPQTRNRLVLTIVSAQYLLHLQSNPISEGRVYDKMVYVGTL